MSETRIEVATGQGIMDGRLFLPEGEGPWPLVVFYMDAFGLRPALSQMGERLSAAGYVVAQPNLYWRHGAFAPFDVKTAFSDPPERERVLALLRSVKAEEAMADTLAIALAVKEHVRGERFGCVGYCMGGRVAFVAATALPGRVAAAASIHGGGLVTEAPDSPHLGIPRIRGVVYLGVADDDPSCTTEHQRTLITALDAAGVQYALEVYPGARHGFAVPDFTIHDEAAAERHWERILSLFAHELG